MTVSGKKTPQDGMNSEPPKSRTVGIALYPRHIAVLKARVSELDIAASEVVRNLLEYEAQTGALAKFLRRRLRVKVSLHQIK